MEEKQYVEIDYPSIEEAVPLPATGAEEPPLRRSTRERHPPDYYRESVATACKALQDPASVQDVLASPDKAKWLHVMEKEMDSLKTNKVWDLVQLPRDRTVVGSKWVFKLKTDADGNVERYKA